MIDDEVETRTIVELILKENNFVVETISKWQYLTYSIQYFKPDLILLDVTLGDADGREICHKLKTSKETKHIPVILFSGYPDLTDNLKGCTPDAIMEKPFDLTKLLDIINSKVL
jgi:Response regulator containing CheY-like receiver, AAA-type ATPase, and DNA-binding domains